MLLRTFITKLFFLNYIFRISIKSLIYRKLVNLLVDVEEWGQVTLLNMLTRYARTQFLDPNIGMDFLTQVVK